MGLTDRKQQQDLAKGYITAFLNLVDRGDTAARNYFLEQPSHLRPLGSILRLSCTRKRGSQLASPKP